MWYFRCISTFSRAVFEFIMCGLLSYCLVDQSLARLFIEIVVPSVLLINMLSASSFAEKCSVLTVLDWTKIGLVFGFSENQHSFMLSRTFDLRPVHHLSSNARVLNKQMLRYLCKTQPCTRTKECIIHIERLKTGNTEAPIAEL